MNWMTVEEVAKYLKLSRMQVYKLAQEGVLPASKVGKVWRFEEGRIDAWLQGQEQVKKNFPFSQKIHKVLEDFSHELKKEFGSNLAQVVVFGSQARGDATEESDVDVMVVLREIADYWKVFSKISNISYAVTFGKGKALVLSSVLMGEREFLTGDSSLILNVRKEGRRAA